MEPSEDSFTKMNSISGSALTCPTIRKFFFRDICFNKLKLSTYTDTPYTTGPIRVLCLLYACTINVTYPVIDISDDRPFQCR